MPSAAGAVHGDGRDGDGVVRHVSYCRLCPAFCGLVVSTRGDRIVSVAGDPDNPVSQGYTCSKGRAAGELHHHPARLDAPYVRGADGATRTLSWPEVLDHVESVLRRVVAESGPDAVAAYRASGWGFDLPGVSVSDPFFRGLGSGQIYSAITIDGPNKVYVPELVTGATVPWSTPDLARTELLLLVGQNPLVSHGHANVVANPVVALREVKARGRIVVVDPRVTETARMADVHVRARPGTDPAFLAFLVREVLAHRPDGAYLEACAQPASVEILRSVVEPYTRARAAAVCDVPEEVLDAALDAVLAAPAVGFASGTGASMNTAANVTEWLGWALLGVTGSLDRPGGTIFNPGVLRAREGIPFPPVADSGARARTRPHIRPVYGGLPTAALADEILAGNIRVLFVMGGNPALVFPETGKVRRALAALEMLVVCDIRHTETTELASVVLPVTGQFERSDLNGAMFFPQTYVQYVPPVVPPGADRRPTTWIFGELSRRMGIPVMGDARVDATLADGFTDDDVLAVVAAGARVPWDEIRAAPHGILVEDAPGPGWMVPDLLPRKLDLAPAPLVGQFATWDRHLPGDGELVLVNRRLSRQMNSTMRDVGRQAELAPFPTLLVHPEDAAVLGVADGDDVVVASRHGESRARAEVTDSIRRGVVSVPHGWGVPNVNQLTSDTEDCDELTGMPRYSGIPVTVRRLVREAAPAAG